MARIRTIKPEFPQSESVGRLTRDARLLFIQLWTLVDDSSRARASSRLLASLLYPYDEDAGEMILGWLVELENGGFIRLYTIDGTHYLDIPKWLKHQKIDRPSVSRIPAYDDSEKQGGVDHKGGSFDEPSTSPREDASIIREPSRALDAGPRTVDLGPRTLDRTPLAQKPSALEQTKDEKAILTYPCRGKDGGIGDLDGSQIWALTQSQADTWTELYRSTDVLGECRRALAWVEANPTKRKTPSGMPKFMVGWLNRADTQAGANTQGGQSRAHPQPQQPLPRACTCGDSYRNSYRRKCVDCDGKPSAAQIDARSVQAKLANSINL